MVNDQLWKVANAVNMKAQPPFEQSSNSSSENISSGRKTPFMDDKEGEGIFVNPSSILKTRIERESAVDGVTFRSKVPE